MIEGHPLPFTHHSPFSTHPFLLPFSLTESADGRTVGLRGLGSGGLVGSNPSPGRWHQEADVS